MSSRRSFTREFKIKVVREVESGEIRPIDASVKYQISSGLLSIWRHKYAGMPVSGQALAISIDPHTRTEISALRRENAHLKEKLAELYLQVDVLKKMESFALQSKSASSSIITAANLDQFKKRVR
jgi:transposase-like protein